MLVWLLTLLQIKTILHARMPANIITNFSVMITVLLQTSLPQYNCPGWMGVFLFYFLTKLFTYCKTKTPNVSFKT